MLTMLTEGFLVSLQIFAFTLIGAVPLGIVVALFAPLVKIIEKMS